MESKNIQNLSDLRRRKEILKLEMKVTQQAIRNTTKQAEDRLKDRLIKGVLIPIGAGGLASLLFQQKEGAQEHRPSWLAFLKQLVDKIDERFSEQQEAKKE